MKKRNKLDNGIFSKVTSKQMESVRAVVVPDTRINLASTLLTPSRDIVPIAEALVAYDTKEDKIVKFIAAFIPPHKNASHDGVKYIISRNQNTGNHKGIVIRHNKNNLPKDKKMFWNPNILVAYLDYSKLPMTAMDAEFRILRAYPAGLRVPYRFEILNFKTNQGDAAVDKRTVRVESVWNSCPPIALAPVHRSFGWFQENILCELSDFSQIDMTKALGLGIDYKLDKAVRSGQLAPEVKQEILHDHSEDPVEEEGILSESEEVSEPISVSLGINNMVEDEEGKPFYVPENPLALNTNDMEDEEEQLVDLHD